MLHCKTLKRTAGILAVALSVSWGAVAAASEDPARDRLDEYAAYLQERRSEDIGYPLNHNIQLEGFYDWLVESGAYKAMSNNAGDPFHIHGNFMNALPFEREVIEFFGPHYGFDLDNLWGLVTFSGTDGNNHGIYFGSKYLEKKTGKKPIVYVSDAAHYSNMRLVDLQNLDLRLIPSDEHGRMIPEDLEKVLEPERPALVVFAMGTTFKGGVDDQEKINAILDKYPQMAVYRHVDAALFGGYLPWTTFKNAVNRKFHKFDSIAVSGHKFFGMDEPAGIFLTTMEVKENQNPFNVTYLDGSMPMINCSRSSLAPLKLWWLIQHVGVEGFTEQAYGMLFRAAWLESEMRNMGWPVWREKKSNTVYFKRPPEEIVKKYDLAPDHDDRLGGDLSHIIVMQHVKQDHLQEFLDDLAAAVK